MRGVAGGVGAGCGVAVLPGGRYKCTGYKCTGGRVPGAGRGARGFTRQPGPGGRVAGGPGVGEAVVSVVENTPLETGQARRTGHGARARAYGARARACLPVFWLYHVYVSVYRCLCRGRYKCHLFKIFLVCYLLFYRGRSLCKVSQKVGRKTRKKEHKHENLHRHTNRQNFYT